MSELSQTNGETLPIPITVGTQQIVDSVGSGIDNSWFQIGLRFESQLLPYPYLVLSNWNAFTATYRICASLRQIQKLTNKIQIQKQQKKQIQTKYKKKDKKHKTKMNLCLLHSGLVPLEDLPQ